MSISDESVEERWSRETAGVIDPTFDPVVGEIVPPVAVADEPESFPIDSFITEEFVASILAMPALMMARRTGHEWWRPEKEEMELLGKGGTPAVRYLVAKYLNDSSGPLAALGVVLGAVYAPKVIRETMERKKPSQPPSTSPQSFRKNAESQPSSDFGDAANPTSNYGYAEMPDE